MPIEGLGRRVSFTSESEGHARCRSLDSDSPGRRIDEPATLDDRTGRARPRRDTERATAKKGNHADDWTPGQTIKVCVCDTPGGEDISGPLQNAMTIWNNSKGGFNGGVLFEWHLSLTDCSEQRRRSATCGSVGIRERAGEPSSPAWIRWR